MRLIDADTVVTIQTYDEMYEEWGAETMTVAEAVDKWSDEGCPRTVDAIPVVRCRDCDFFWEYTAEYKAKVKKDGDCGFRCMNGGEDHFCMVTNDDYCSLARRKKNAVD